MKESGKERLKSTIYESTLSTADAVPLPHAGKAYMVAASPHFIYGVKPAGDLRLGGFRLWKSEVRSLMPEVCLRLLVSQSPSLLV